MLVCPPVPEATVRVTKVVRKTKDNMIELHLGSEDPNPLTRGRWFPSLLVRTVDLPGMSKCCLILE